jgi:YfiH family protein
VEWLEFDLLAEIPGFVHGVFLRSGGASRAPYASLNTGKNVGDDPLLVKANCERIAQALGVSLVFSTQQVHGSEITWVRDRDDVMGSADGMMTQLQDAGLMVMHADCQPTIFYDPIQRAVAVVHAGWRGLVQNIYGACLAQMGLRFGSKAQDILVGIGPSLGPKRAEFQNYQREFPESFWRFQTQDRHFNLWEVGRWQLEQAGVLAHHIEVAGICTYSDPESWYSYRRDKQTGRNATLAFLSNRDT